MDNAERKRIYDGIAVDGVVSALELAKSSEEVVATLTEIFAAIKQELAAKDLFIQTDQMIVAVSGFTDAWLAAAKVKVKSK